VDHDDILPGRPLDRQERPVRLDASGRRLLPNRVPETRPTPLQQAFIPLSVVVLVCGVVAITALELGTPLGSPIVKVPVLLGGTILVAVTIDAIVRIWRSAWAWLPVDRGLGVFRFVWVAALVVSLVVIVAVTLIVASA
jgi:hypothetical protein